MPVRVPVPLLLPLRVVRQIGRQKLVVMNRPLDRDAAVTAVLLEELVDALLTITVEMVILEDEHELVTLDNRSDATIGAEGPDPLAESPPDELLSPPLPVSLDAPPPVPDPVLEELAALLLVELNVLVLADRVDARVRGRVFYNFTSRAMNKLTINVMM